MLKSSMKRIDPQSKSQYLYFQVMNNLLLIQNQLNNQQNHQRNKKNGIVLQMFNIGQHHIIQMNPPIWIIIRTNGSATVLRRKLITKIYSQVTIWGSLVVFLISHSLRILMRTVYHTHQLCLRRKTNLHPRRRDYYVTRRRFRIGLKILMYY